MTATGEVDSRAMTTATPEGAECALAREFGIRGETNCAARREPGQTLEESGLGKGIPSWIRMSSSIVVTFGVSHFPPLSNSRALWVRMIYWI